LTSYLPKSGGALTGPLYDKSGVEIYGTPTGAPGTVTSVSVTTANGVSGSVATATTTPAISLTLGAIAPTSVAASGTVTGSNLSGTNTGNQVVPANEAGASNNFLTAYNSSTGAWTKAQPTWANVDKATSSIADITTRSHTALSDIGTNTHSQIDTDLSRLTNTSGSNTGDQTLAGLGGVPTSRTVNSHALTDNVTVSKSDVGLGSVPNTDCTTTANITDSTNKRFITDAQQTVLGNTSNTNTGDQTITLSGAVSGTGTGAITTALADISPSPAGAFTNATVTVNVKGLVTSASNGLAIESTRLLYGTAADGNVTLSENTTMTRDMFYNNLVLDGFTLNMAGYRVFARTISGAGKLKAATGGTGGNGTNAVADAQGTGGSAGTGVTGNTVPSSAAGKAGVDGADSQTVPNNPGFNAPGTAGTATTNSLGTTSGATGANGGAGGDYPPNTGSNDFGGTGIGGSGGTATQHTKQNFNDYMRFCSWVPVTFTTLKEGGGSGSGGGGGSGAYGSGGYSGAGGGGGGGGGNAGMWFVSVLTASGSWTVEALGGAGGNAGNGSAAVGEAGGGGGGAGGTGGNGGSGIFIYNNWADWTGSFVLTGGAGGSPGTGGSGAGSGQAGASGSTGATGAAGIAYQIAG